MLSLRIVGTVGSPPGRYARFEFLLGIIDCRLKAGMKVDFRVLAVSGEFWICLNNVAAENTDLKLFHLHHNYLAVAMSRFRVHSVENEVCMHLTVHAVNCTLGVAQLPVRCYPARMQPATDRRAKKLSELSHTARKTADKLEFLQDAIRAEGVALALVRFREAHGERAAIVDLRSAASVLRAYAAILESNVRMAAMRDRKAAKAAAEQNAEPTTALTP